MSDAAFEYEAEDLEGDEMEADNSEDEGMEDVEDTEDEAFYEMSEDSGEDEAEPEADGGEDEADGGEDEAVQMSATARMQAQTRQDFWARRLAADQRKDAARAAET